MIGLLSATGKAIRNYEQQRSLLVDDLLVRFTPTEYTILCQLLSGDIVSDTNLIQKTFITEQPDKTLKTCLDKHIENIRSKIRPTGLNIFRVNGFGYVLRNSPDQW